MNASQSKSSVVPFQSQQKDQSLRIAEDEFLSLKDLVPVHHDAAARQLARISAEIGELTRENRWADALALFHPVEEKLPEIATDEMRVRIREKNAFALGQIKRFDEAMAELKKCLAVEPDNFFHHSSLAYTAYNSLYAARNREIFLSGNIRKERIETAHRHFKAAQALRPDGVTNFYREGMLWKQIEDKVEKALPLFHKAVSNWEACTEDERERRHQERKNYVKSLYQLAGSLLETGKAMKSLDALKKCMTADEGTDLVSLVHKYFALGKIHYQLNRNAEARDALLFALQCQAGPAPDYVCELLGRTYLSMEAPEKALEVLGKVPEKHRRAYFLWTIADAQCALKNFEAARKTLAWATERDTRAKHKSLLRLAKIEYVHGRFEAALEHAKSADAFFRKTWGNACADALFWQAAASLHLGQKDAARGLAEELRTHAPFYPKLERLLTATGQG